MLKRTPVHRIGTVSTALANAVLHIAHWAGLQSPTSVLLLAGSLFRGLSLPLTLYGDKSMYRVAGALPELHDAHKSYLDIVEHPDAISWEKRVAADKLKNDRARIFRSHHTNNLKMTLPYAGAVSLSLYCLGVPAQQLGQFFLQDAGMDLVSPLSVSYVAAADVAAASFTWTSALPSLTTAAASSSASTAVGAAPLAVLFTVDPTLTIAASLTCFNAICHLRSRRGFNTQLDRHLVQLRQVAFISTGLVAAGSLLTGPLAYLLGVHAVHFFPPYLAAVWLGMSATTTIKTLLINGTRPGRALFDLCDYPPQHGRYGDENTASAHEYRLAFTGLDVEERVHLWQSQKRILDYECDLRLQRMLRKVGLFDDLEELAMESEKLEHKRASARQRRLAREEKERKEKETSAGAAPPTPSAQRRQVMRSSELEDGAMSHEVREELVAANMDRVQEEETKWRHELRAQRAKTWEKKH